MVMPLAYDKSNYFCAIACRNLFCTLW